MVRKSIIIRVAIIIVGIVIVGLGRGLFYYAGSYSPPPGEKPGYDRIIVPQTPTTVFTDTPADNISRTILIDLAHDNAFNQEELNVLILRLVARGSTIDFLTWEDDLKTELLANGAEEEEQDPEREPLGNEEEAVPGEAPPGDEEKPSPADALIVVCPRSEFSREERETIDEFIKKGGKLLLIADPTRRSEINSLSLRFGLIFEPDYLYNMNENETNYRNIFVADFEDNDITRGVKKMALYTAGSISSANSSIAFVDENTFSSVVGTRTRLSPIALAQEAKVLAIHDLTFMTEPNNGILDNNQLISNIADWLMSPAEGAESK